MDTTVSNLTSGKVWLKRQPGFFRFTFEDIKMPNNIQNMGLLGINYFSEITPLVYAGIGGYGSVTGTQGGLFVLGFGGGLHHEFFPHWWGDAGLMVGGGGGRSSLVGGGLMLRPYIGIEYSWQSLRIGLHYSDVNFPSGLIHSQQIGLDFDIPFDIYYVIPDQLNSEYSFKNIVVANGKYLTYQRNDFGLVFQAYRQQAGTKNVNGVVQDGTIGLVGAEFDHYFSDKFFGYVKMAGAYRGIPNGYMDILGGFGLHWKPTIYNFAVVPQFGMGAGGGGNVQTGGGIIVQPQIGLEVPLTTSFATRLSGGYLWAPKGNLKAETVSLDLLYHLDFVTAGPTFTNNLLYIYKTHDWRLQFVNQTYLHPQRSSLSTTAAINLIVFQIDQIFTPHIFFSYQAASAYTGNHAGGYASGMIGPGLQTNKFMNQHTQLFAEVLMGAGGGGNLAMGGGLLVEPVIGARIALTKAIGVQGSISQVKAVHGDLNTPAINLGLTINFGMLGYQ